MSAWDKLLSYETLVRAVAGSVSSVTAMTIFFPLDTVRSKLQLEDRKAKSTTEMLTELINEEGFASLYRGLVPVQQSLCVSGFVYFYTFHGLRAVFASNKAPGNGNSAGRDLLLGSVAGCINVLMTSPMWVVNTRMKLQRPKSKKKSSSKRSSTTPGVDTTCQSNGSGEKKHSSSKKKTHYKGIIDGLIKITNQEGAAALWSGTVPSLILVSNPAIQFMCYEWMKRRMLHLMAGKPLTSVQIFALGAMAKSISTLMTYPVQVVQSRLRYGSSDVKGKPIYEIFMQILSQQGLPGLYRGLESKLLQTVLTTAVMFVCYEKIVWFVFRLMSASSKAM